MHSLCLPFSSELGSLTKPCTSKCISHASFSGHCAVTCLSLPVSPPSLETGGRVSPGAAKVLGRTWLPKMTVSEVCPWCSNGCRYIRKKRKKNLETLWSRTAGELKRRWKVHTHALFTSAHLNVFLRWACEATHDTGQNRGNKINQGSRNYKHFLSSVSFCTLLPNFPTVGLAEMNPSLAFSITKFFCSCHNWSLQALPKHFASLYVPPCHSTNTDNRLLILVP